MSKCSWGLLVRNSGGCHWCPSGGAYVGYVTAATIIWTIWSQMLFVVCLVCLKTQMMTHSLILIWAHLLWSQVIFECKNIVWNGTQHTWKHLRRISDHKAEKTPCGVAHYWKWFHSVVEQFLRIWCVADFSCLIFIHATFRGPTMALLHGQKLLSLVASFDSKNLLFFLGQRTRKVAALQRLILFESRCFVGDRQKQPTHTHTLTNVLGKRQVSAKRRWFRKL